MDYTWTCHVCHEFTITDTAWPLDRWEDFGEAIRARSMSRRIEFRCHLILCHERPVKPNERS